jgi:hypothetical protein
VGDRICFHNKRGWTGGVLDVDMNAGSGTTREAVENVVWSSKPPDGTYCVIVNNFTFRESSDPGFVVEVESGGRLSHYSFNKGVRDKQDVRVVALHVKGGIVERFEVVDPAISAANVSQEKWGLRTEQYVKVGAVMLSPNFWGEVIADKTKCAPSADQLSGLGFSSTKRESFVVRARQGKRQRLFNVRVCA